MSVIDKRADAVIRWLERMKRSYSSGRVESAYFDAECASADLENLRTNIFVGIAPKTRSCVPSFVRVILLSLLMLVLTAMPLSVENAPLHVLYADETPQGAVKVEEPQELPPASAAAMPKPKRVRRNAPPKRSEPAKPNPKPKPVTIKKRPAYEQMNHLLETGRRALKSDVTVIKIK